MANPANWPISGKIAKMALFNPCMEFKNFLGQMTSFEVLRKCHFVILSKMCLRLRPCGYVTNQLIVLYNYRYYCVLWDLRSINGFSDGIGGSSFGSIKTGSRTINKPIRRRIILIVSYNSRYCKLVDIT